MLKATDGVTNATVNLADRTVAVDFDATLATTENLKKAVQSIGYDLVVDDVN
jgi:Cu2+-exporting ATPase